MNKNKQDSFASARSVGNLACVGLGYHQPRKDPTVIMDDALPGIKSFFKATSVKPNAVGMLIRLVAAFTCHIGRMSAAQAAGSIRSQTRHRAALVRFLAQVKWSRDWQVLTQVAELLWQAEAARQGTSISSSIRPIAANRAKRQKTPSVEPITGRGPRTVNGDRRNTPGAVPWLHHGLVADASGLRLPCCRSYYTEAYCSARRKRIASRPSWQRN